MPQLRPVGIDLGTQNVRAAWSDGRAGVDLLRWTEPPPAAPMVQGIPGPDEGRLRFVGRQARARLGPARFALVVPTTATSSHRELWFERPVAAGLEPLCLIDAMQAACWAMEAPDLAGSLPQTGHWLLVDAGANHVEAAVVRRSSGAIQVVAAASTVALGGNLLDRALADWLRAQAADTDAPSPAAEGGGSSALACETARELRESLSARQRVVTTWQSGASLRQLAVHRHAYQLQTTPFAEELSTLVKELRMHTPSHVPWDRVVLLGGLGRTPWVQELLSHLTQSAVLRWPCADELLARGAALALAAQQDSKQPQRAPVSRIATCCGRQVLLSPSEQPESARLPTPVFSSTTPLPAEQQVGFATARADQRSLVLYLFERSSDSQPLLRTARVVVESLPPGLPPHWPIELSVRANEEGRLCFSAAVRGIRARPGVRVEWEPPLAAGCPEENPPAAS